MENKKKLNRIEKIYIAFFILLLGFVLITNPTLEGVAHVISGAVILYLIYLFNKKYFK